MDRDALPIPRDVHWLRITGLIEGTSTLLLFAVAMPLKYGLGMDMAVRIVGSVHGFLFLLYIGYAALIVRRYGWPWLLWLWMFIAACIPFGPFVVDRRLPLWYRRHAKSTTPEA